MGYKFICNKCEKETISNYCEIGENVHCKICSTLITIPADAIKINDSEILTNSTNYINEASNSQAITIQILKVFGIFDLVIGIIIAIYIFVNCGIMDNSNSNQVNYFTLSIIISFILQGIFAYAFCNAVALIVENLIKINATLEKK